MTITEDDKFTGVFRAQVRQGEYILFRGQLDWNDKNAGLRLEYWLEGEKILYRRTEERWWWRFVGNPLERELEDFMHDGMNRATEIRTAQKKSADMANAARILFKDQ